MSNITKSAAWKRAHELNWVLRCLMGCSATLRFYSKCRFFPEDIRAMLAGMVNDLDRMERQIRLKIHEHARKGMGIEQ